MVGNREVIAESTSWKMIISRRVSASLTFEEIEVRRALRIARISSNETSGPEQFLSAPRLRLKRQSQSPLTPSVNTSRILGTNPATTRSQVTEPMSVMAILNGNRRDIENNYLGTHATKVNSSFS
jgi:hypothetical protein